MLTGAGTAWAWHRPVLVLLLRVLLLSLLLCLYFLLFVRERSSSWEGFLFFCVTFLSDAILLLSVLKPWPASHCWILQVTHCLLTSTLQSEHGGDTPLLTGLTSMSPLPCPVSHGRNGRDSHCLMLPCYPQQQALGSMSSKLKIKAVIPRALLGAGKVTTRRVIANPVSSSETSSQTSVVSLRTGAQGNHVLQQLWRLGLWWM